MLKSTFFTAFCCFCSTVLWSQSGLKMFDESYVHEIRIQFDEPDFWEILSLNYNFEDDGDPNTINAPLMVKVEVDGTSLDSVAVNQKGFYSNWGAGGSLKKPLKVDFNEFVADQEYDDLKSLNLQNAFKDPSLMRDVVSYRILRDFGVAAPRTSYAKVYLNDQYWGLYVVVESVNKTFLKEHFGDNDGNLYKAGFANLGYFGQDQTAYYDQFELKTNETANDWSRLVDFLKLVNQTPISTFKDSLRAHFDLTSYFKSMAVDVTIVNWDSHFDHGRNFYLYDNPSDGKFYWIPWDYNLSFAGSGYNYDIAIKSLRNSLDYDKILPKRVLGNTTLRNEYLQIACELHQNVFTPDRLFPFIEQNEALIVDALEDDPNKFYEDINDFHTSLTDGFLRTTIDSFHIVDSFWDGNMWNHIDTVFTFEYTEEFPGLKSLISSRHTDIQTELSQVYGVTCLSGTQEPLANSSLEIWPNPGSEWLNIKISEPETTLSIYDIHGRLCKRGRFEETQFALSIQEFPPGMYWVESLSKNGRNVEKLVVAR